MKVIKTLNVLLVGGMMVIGVITGKPEHLLAAIALATFNTMVNTDKN